MSRILLVKSDRPWSIMLKTQVHKSWAETQPLPEHNSFSPLDALRVLRDNYMISIADDSEGKLHYLT